MADDSLAEQFMDIFHRHTDAVISGVIDFGAAGRVTVDPGAFENGAMGGFSGAMAEDNAQASAQEVAQSFRGGLTHAVKARHAAKFR